MDPKSLPPYYQRVHQYVKLLELLSAIVEEAQKHRLLTQYCTFCIGGSVLRGDKNEITTEKSLSKPQQRISPGYIYITDGPLSQLKHPSREEYTDWKYLFEVNRGASHPYISKIDLREGAEWVVVLNALKDIAARYVPPRRQHTINIAHSSLATP